SGWLFFFSSRRRHTRSKRDWSSDVCSSDLVGEAWAFFATLVGVAASVGTMVAAMYEVANLRQNPPLVAASPANPLGIMTFALTGVWFLVANLLLWRTRTPRVLVLLGFVAAADLVA